MQPPSQPRKRMTERWWRLDRQKPIEEREHWTSLHRVYCVSSGLAKTECILNEWMHTYRQALYCMKLSKMWVARGTDTLLCPHNPRASTPYSHYIAAVEQQPSFSQKIFETRLTFSITSIWHHDAEVFRTGSLVKLSSCSFFASFNQSLIIGPHPFWPQSSHRFRSRKSSASRYHRYDSSKQLKQGSWFWRRMTAYPCRGLSGVYTNLQQVN